ncbi:hypothetical protein Aduo_018174 [Ancylostoma duodenale]
MGGERGSRPDDDEATGLICVEAAFHRVVHWLKKCPLMSEYASLTSAYFGRSRAKTPLLTNRQHIGNNIIRGCFASVFKYGATPRAQSSPILDTSCSRMPAHRLLPPHMAARSSNRSVELCWCVGQLCNDYPSVPMNSMSVNVFTIFYERPPKNDARKTSPITLMA